MAAEIRFNANKNGVKDFIKFVAKGRGLSEDKVKVIDKNKNGVLDKHDEVKFDRWVLSADDISKHIRAFKIRVKVENVLNPTKPKVTGAALMDQIGQSYDVPMFNGSQTKCSVVIYAKLKKFCDRKHINLKKILNTNYGEYKAEAIKNKDVPSAFNKVETADNNNYSGGVNNGYLVSLDLYQLSALLSAITNKCPEYAGTIGLYGIRDSLTVARLLHKAGLVKKDISWFWTGQRYSEGSVESDYLGRGMLIPSKSDVSANRFITRAFDSENWFDYNPAFYADQGVVVLGGLK